MATGRRPSSRRQGAWISGGATSFWDYGTDFIRFQQYQGYEVWYTVYWQLANSTLIGKRTIGYNQLGDYQLQPWNSTAWQKFMSGGSAVVAYWGN